MRKETLAIIALIISQLFWGGSYLLSTKALEVFPPATLVSLRIVIAVVVLGIIGFASGQIKRIRREDLKYLIIAAVCEPFVYFMCEAGALQRVSPTVASVVLALVPLLMPLFAYLFLSETITLTNVGGIAVSLVGVMMIIVHPGGTLAVDFIGLAMLGVAVVSSITYSMMMRKIPSDYNAITIVFWMFCVSLLFFIPTALVREYKEVSQIDFSLPSTAEALWHVVALALTASCVAFLFFSYGIRTIGATKANAFNNMQPGVTAVMAWLLLSEQMSVLKIVGITVVIGGMFVSQLDFVVIARKAVEGTVTVAKGTYKISRKAVKGTYKMSRKAVRKTEKGVVRAGKGVVKMGKKARRSFKRKGRK